MYIQNIERLWRDMHSALPRFGIREGHYEHYLAEFIFKKRMIFTFFVNIIYIPILI